jgi:hypothetical protein
MTKDEALRLALEALKYHTAQTRPIHETNEAITAIKAALEAKDEPVACKECHLKDTVYDLLGDLKVANLKLSARSQRTWVGLTDDEIVLIVAECAASHQHTDIHFARAIEAKLKEKNT